MSMYIRLNENENQRTGFEDLDQCMERTMNVSVAVVSVRGEKPLEIHKKHRGERHKKSKTTKITFTSIPSLVFSPILAVP